MIKRLEGGGGGDGSTRGGDETSRGRSSLKAIAETDEPRIAERAVLVTEQPGKVYCGTIDHYARTCGGIAVVSFVLVTVVIAAPKSEHVHEDIFRAG